MTHPPRAFGRLCRSAALALAIPAAARAQDSTAAKPSSLPTHVAKSAAKIAVQLSDANVNPHLATNCSHELRFVDKVTVNGGPVDVQYVWERSDGATMQPKTYHFPGAHGGSATLADTWTVGADSGKDTRVWERLKVLSPVQRQSPEIVANVRCVKAKAKTK